MNPSMPAVVGTGFHSPDPKQKVVQPPEKVFKYKCTFSGTINDTMNRRGWVQVDEDAEDWDIFWCDLNQLRELYTNRSLEDWQRVGHFRNCFEISRKNLMVRNLKRLRYRIEKAWGKEEGDKLDFYPTTFILPTEHKQFILEYRRCQGTFWIIKPAAGAQGRGIYIFERLKDYFEWRGKFDSPENELILRHQQQQLREQDFRQQIQEQLAATDKDKERDQLKPTLESTNLSQPHREFLTVTEPNLAATDSDASGKPEKLDDATCLDSDANIDPILGSSVDASTIMIGTSKIIVEPNKNDVYVVQRYIAKPYLIGGRKFDIRLYVLVTSFAPLKAWMYREGFARFSRGQFSLKSLRDVYVHLTNVAIQRTSEDYDAEKGSKWSLHNLREYMTARHGPEVVQKLMNEIDTIVIRTLQSVQHQIHGDKHCFELYGFDVIIENNLKPWLLEVNASPAFTPSNEEDYRLKCALIDDAVHVLDLEGRLTGFEKRVGGYDLFWNEYGVVYANPEDCGYVTGDGNEPKVNTYLGCLNDRVAQLRNTLACAKYIKDVKKIQNQGSSTSGNSGISGTGAFTDVPVQAFNKSNSKIKSNRYRVPE